MKTASCTVIVAMGLLLSPAVFPMSYPPEPVTRATEPSAAASLGAAVGNIVYFPIRLLTTVVTAELGGFTGWMTGGNEPAARAVWHSTEGQAFLTPEMVEGREPLRIGSWGYGAPEVEAPEESGAAPPLHSNLP